jgi:hypothetical protein
MLGGAAGERIGGDMKRARKTASSTNEDILCRYFTGLICDTPQFRSSRKIRQVLPWIGFVVGALRFVGDLDVSHKRQLTFVYADRKFKVKFQHAGLQSGIRIVEVLPGQGSPEGGDVFFIRSLKDAEQFYNEAPSILKQAA